ncbi:MAG TPA: four helix bundle protein [Candidatus Paceibacterota bacterium]
MEQENQKGYRKLIVWQKADELAFQIYLVTKNFPRDEIFGLTSQMRRAAVSVSANITEGYARSSRKEKMQFYNIARGSLTEVEYYIDFSFRLGYVTKENYPNLVKLRDETGRLLHGFIQSVKK